MLLIKKKTYRGSIIAMVKLNISLKFANDKIKSIKSIRCHGGGFPGGPAVKNSPANAGTVGSVPGPKRSHMSWSN